MTPEPDDLNEQEELESRDFVYPDDRETFRLAQLVLMFEIADEFAYVVPTIDRLGYFDFFSANPFIVVGGDEAADEADRLTLRLAGFSRKQINYGSAGPRFASRRKKLQHDLARLISLDLVELRPAGYQITSYGRSIAEQLSTVYADAYREAARIVLRRLRRTSDTKLTARVGQWLGSSWLLIDFMDDVRDVVPGEPSDAGGE